MKISELKEELDLKALTEAEYADEEITGCYIGDLLSWVMSNAEAGNVWITIMNNINIVAVASLCNVSCVILAENVSLPEEAKKKAEAVGVTVFGTSKTAYELAGRIYCGEKLC